MKTLKQQETEAILALFEANKVLELQLDLAKKRIEELEKETQNVEQTKIIANG
jgi:hypothetical protein